MSLIVFGVMFKVFLHKALEGYNQQNEPYGEVAHRLLGGGGSYVSDEAAAALFCGGLTALLLCMELMELTVRLN